MKHSPAKRSPAKKSAKSPELNRANLLVASLLVVAWFFVIETFVPSDVFNSAPMFWNFMTAFSPFLVAIVVAYALIFDHYKSQYLRIALSLVVGIGMFLFGLALGPLSQLLPVSLGYSLDWGNLIIAIYFGASCALIAEVASKVQPSRKKNRAAS